MCWVKGNDSPKSSGKTLPFGFRRLLATLKPFFVSFIHILEGVARSFFV